MSIKKEILKAAGVKSEEAFYKKYPTQEAFLKDHPNFEMKLGGSLPEAFNMSMPADKFFSYGVPVPPTYYEMGGSLTNVPVYPQAQTEAQFFSPVYSNTNNAYRLGGNLPEVNQQTFKIPDYGMGNTNYFMLQEGGMLTADMIANPYELPILEQGNMQMGGEPPESKNQNFPSQKLNSFMSLLKENAYNATEKEFTNNLANSVGMKYGGLKKFQTAGAVTSPPTTAATTSTGTGATEAKTERYTNIKTPYGPALLDTTNNQLFFENFEYPQQRQRVQYPYNYNQQGFWGGDGVYNFMDLYPNQRVKWRTVKGRGMENLTPEEWKQIQGGLPEDTKIDIETRRAILPGNRVKSISYTVPFSRQKYPTTGLETEPAATRQGVTTVPTIQDPGAAPVQTSDEQQALTSQNYSSMPPIVDTGLGPTYNWSTSSNNTTNGNATLDSQQLMERLHQMPSTGYPEGGGAGFQNTRQRMQYMLDNNMLEDVNQDLGILGYKKGGVFNGGPYALPMFQLGTQVDDPFADNLFGMGPEVDIEPNPMYNTTWETGQNKEMEDVARELEQESYNKQFGVDVGRQTVFDPMFAKKIQAGTDFFGGFGQNAKDRKRNARLSRAHEQVDSLVSGKGDYNINTGRFRENQMVPGNIAQVGGQLAYQNADNYYLTPQMLNLLKYFGNA